MPWRAVPRPGGSPLPSGPTAMSHAWISSGVAGRPKPKRGGVELGPPCCFAHAPRAVRIRITPARRTLRLEPKGDGAVALHAPRPDVIEMVGGTQPACLA